MSELTVVCWKWNGWRKNMYDASHVNTLHRMVSENLHIPHRFVCVTDDPEGVRCETIPLWEQPHNIQTGVDRPNCWRRLKIFSPEAKEIFGERVLSIDLDVVVLGDLTPLITDDDFKAMKGKASPLNGSMFLHKTGTRTKVWEGLSRHAPDLISMHERKTDVRHYGSDQAWMSFKMPDAPVWTPEDGAYHFTLVGNELPENCRIMFFAGSNKPWSGRCKERLPEVAARYREVRQQVMSEA